MFGCTHKIIVKVLFFKKQICYDNLHTIYYCDDYKFVSIDQYTNYNIYLNSINGETLSIFNMCLAAPLFSQLTIKFKNVQIPF